MTICGEGPRRWTPESQIKNRHNEHVLDHSEGPVAGSAWSIYIRGADAESPQSSEPQTVLRYVLFFVSESGGL